MLSFVKKAKPYHVCICMYIFITMTGVNDQTIGSSSSIGLSFVELENYFGKTQVELEVKESLSVEVTLFSVRKQRCT